MSYERERVRRLCLRDEERTEIGLIVGGVIGGVAGARIGSGIGIAAAGTAIAGTWPLLLIGLIFGGAGRCEHRQTQVTFEEGMTIEPNFVATESQRGGNRSVIVTLGLFTLLAVVTPRSVAESTEDSIDYFKLFADCTRMNLVVEHLPSDASEIGLWDEAIQAAVESRLRSARLYRSEFALVPYLYVSVNVVGPAFSIDLGFKKILFDGDFAYASGSATTWSSSSTGTHGGDAGYIVLALSQHVDRFLVEFLRVNEDACE